MKRAAIVIAVLGMCAGSFGQSNNKPAQGRLRQPRDNAPAAGQAAAPQGKRPPAGQDAARV